MAGDRRSKLFVILLVVGMLAFAGFFGWETWQFLTTPPETAPPAE